MNVRWYLKYLVSYRRLEEMMAERGIKVDHTTIIDQLKNDKILPKNVSLRQIKYLNNIVEQDHISIKLIVRPMLGFQSFYTAIKTLKGIEIMHMIKKGQVGTLNRGVLSEVNFINKLFGIVV